MPSIWWKLKPPIQWHIVEYIDDSKVSTPKDEPLWSAENVKHLTQFIPLKQMNNIQILYYFATENPALIDFVHGEESDDDSDSSDESDNEEEDEMSGMESDEERNDDSNNGGEEVDVSP
eukprot:12588804-Ditylum_brightwellii.AAC.2